MINGINVRVLDRCQEARFSSDGTASTQQGDIGRQITPSTRWTQTSTHRPHSCSTAGSPPHIHCPLVPRIGCHIRSAALSSSVQHRWFPLGLQLAPLAGPTSSPDSPGTELYLWSLLSFILFIYKHYLNKKYSDIWPNITEQKGALKNAEDFEDEEGKYEKYFHENIK